MKLMAFAFCLFVFNSLAQESKNITLLDNWFSDTLLTNSSHVRFSGCWAFEYDGHEYGVIGSTEGAHFFELTEADTFKFIDFVPGRYTSSQAITREYKSYQNYIYATGDEGGSSLQIIDISYLPDSVSLVKDIQNTEIGKIHNLFIDTTNALLYACSVTPFLNGQELSLVPLKVFSLSDPLNPTLQWQVPDDLFEVHDVFVRDNLAILNCGYEGIRVYDFSNLSQPNNKSNLGIYQDQGYNHQGWLSPDGETYVFADETAGKKIKKATLNSDLSITINSLFGSENEPYDKTAHNIHCTDEFAFVAYYNDGLRIYDLRINPPQEIAYYDTHQDEPGNTFSMWGAWGIYALLPSGRILVSDRNSGFYLFDFDRDFFLNQAANEVQIYPNPVEENQQFTIRMSYDKIEEFDYELYDLNGKILSKLKVFNQSFVQIDSPKISGIYFLKVNYLDSFSNKVSVFKKLVVE